MPGANIFPSARPAPATPGPRSLRTGSFRGACLRAAALLLTLALIAPRPAGAARGESPDLAPLSAGDVTFFANVATLLDVAGRTKLRFFLDVPYEGLRFLSADDGFAATLDVTILVYDGDGDQVSGDLWTVPLRIATAAESREPGREFRRAYELPAIPGRLQVSVTVAQSETGRTGRWGGRIEVPNLLTGPIAMSDLVVGRCVTDSAAADPAYPGCLFAPGTGRGDIGEGRVFCVYGEIYDRESRPDSVYELRYDLVSASGKVMESWNAEVPRRGRRGTYCLRPPLAGLTLGTFGLRVEARIGNATARSRRSFQTDEARGELLEDKRKARVLLGYIAGSEELVRLESLPNDSLEAFWGEFWRKRDPSPGTTRNESLQEFMRRVEYADTHFSVLDEGWNSDMGRIYIRHGTPDQIERTPVGTSSTTTEIWHYFERNLRFVFVDYDGFGRFRLVGSERG